MKLNRENEMKYNILSIHISFFLPLNNLEIIISSLRKRNFYLKKN